ncbi:transglycosylase SLT domain-containing protein [Alloalcanivorax sp. C16-2]|uniref:transglycosylase SLT domain-containing protein n=1 Tax=Alloalcanivorax sp. C16-2 TaxID=3390052 RepID=UPI003970EB05
MFRSAVLAVIAVIVAMPAQAADTPFQEALHAARNDDWETLSRAQNHLGDHHPLQAYLDFHRLRAALPDLNPQRVRDYAERYPDSPLPNDIRQLALVAYARDERWDAARAVYDSAPRSTELSCLYWHAQWQAGNQEALNQARELWLSGNSRPSACDPIFNAARQHGQIGDKEIWRRMELAFYERSPGLMRYLRPMLDDSAYATAADWLLDLYGDPDTLTDLPKDLADDQRQVLLAAGFRRLAYTDTETAREWFEDKRGDLGFTDAALVERAGQRIAWYSTIRGVEDNRDWLDQWLREKGGDDLLDQRARRAIIEQNWDELPDWVARLSQGERKDSRWLYWLGRAAEENGDDDKARSLWQQAAGQRNFYGFLAADRIGEAYRFANAVPTGDQPLPDLPALARVKLLREQNEPGLAWSEWNWLMWHSDENRQRQLAQYAVDAGWYDLAVQASIQARAWDVLAWRFPAAHRERFREAARRNNLDPWLPMAVARRESAFYPNARSPVGALGLMQLMPGTARKVSREAGQAVPGEQQILNPDTNIALGSRYLADLLKQFNGNRILALAAYNAGPNRVEQWLADKEDDAVPVDVWIESIPFRETRAYVQAVLTYRVLFQGLHGDAEERTALLLLPRERGTPYSVAMIED